MSIRKFFEDYASVALNIEINAISYYA